MCNLDLLECSCHRLIREKTSISSVFGEDLHGYSVYEDDGMDNENDSNIIYDSDEDNIIQYAQSNEPLNFQEMPTSVCESKNFQKKCPVKIFVLTFYSILKVLDKACNDEKGILNYVYDSELSRCISIMFMPWTLPLEFSLNFTKK